MEYSLTFLIILVIFWMICGIVDYGICFTHFQRAYSRNSEESYSEDMLIAILAFFVGPFGLIASLMMGFYSHVFKWI
jgi:hypothetical protein